MISSLSLCCELSNNTLSDKDTLFLTSILLKLNDNNSFFTLSKIPLSCSERGFRSEQMTFQ